MTVDPDEAEQFAQQFIEQSLPGGQADEAERFYGYYTVHILLGGQVYGMLSVNGYTGQVWYHYWHGQFIGMRELS
jgi:hypothetical protein